MSLEPTRRAGLRLLIGGVAGSALLAGDLWRPRPVRAAGVSGGDPLPTPPNPAATIPVDPTFAENLLRALADGSGTSATLLDHPALAALVRHQRIQGNATADAGALLDRLLDDPGDREGAARVLAAWEGRWSGLGRAAAEALAHLPVGTPLGGTLYLVVGYDIGVVAPPDMALNVAHPHFVADPGELAFYATHEAHHAGFLVHRPFPALEGLDDPTVLASVVRFCTQMEGMAVHAAYPGRASAGALGGDPDYEIYGDEALASRTCERYREVLGLLAGQERIEGPRIGQILGAMSAEERLWYRVGALAARRIEADGGREALARSVLVPEAFDEAVDRLLVERGP